MTEEEYYAKIKAEYEASTDEKLVEWARPYFEGTKKPNSKEKYVICPVSERAASDIMELTGSDVHGFTHVLRCDEVAHINKRHGKKGIADNSMRDIADLGRIAFVLNNYDYLETDGKPVFGFTNKSGRPAALVRYVKRINGNVYTAEAVSDSPKRHTLFVQSMYKAKTSELMAKKNELAATAQLEPSPYVQNDANSITSILTQPGKNVKPPNENNSNSPKTEYDVQLDRQLAEQLQTHISEVDAMNIPPERKAELRLGIEKIYSRTPPTTTEIKAELRGKTPREIENMTRNPPQKTFQNGKNASGKDGKTASGNGSGGNSGR